MRSILSTLITLIVFLSVPLSSFALEPGLTGSPLSQALLSLLEQKPAQYLHAGGQELSSQDIDREIFRFYDDQNFVPVWVTKKGPTRRAEIALSYIEDADKDGLFPKNYRVDRIRALWEKRDEPSLAKLEFLMTLAVAGYVTDMRQGRVEVKRLDPKLFANARSEDIDVVAVAKEAVLSKDIDDYLSNSAPKNRFYQQLRWALAEYRKLEANGGWKAIPGSDALKPGDDSPRVIAVRERLAVTGDMGTGNITSPLFDADVEAGVKRFQKRHRIDVDGKIGKQTLAEMNVPVEKRVKQIIVNMERWRWALREIKGKQVAVNIAGYNLGSFQDGSIEQVIPVIVGKTYHKTPVFSNQIRYIEFNPYWNVPNSIARNESLPNLQRNPGAYKAKGFRVFRGWGDDSAEVDILGMNWNSVSKSEMNKFRVRQDPGPKNALGTVKFMFPNKYNVYLHDTPTHSLFQKTGRAFSHGCIRVSKPHEFAEWLLGGSSAGWPLSRVKEVIESGKRTIVNLDKPIPVTIAYRTAMVSGKEIQFIPDIYGRDKLLEKAIFG